ncbi:GtrA family protein [Candidatus Saccharibacteria bacterium]|nr:GtrA family protein [Candidatus Saccharibacteria bacterium]
MKKFAKFFGLGVGTTLIEYLIFTVAVRILGNDLIWLATLIGGVIGTVIAYFINSRLVWKEGGKVEAAKFIIYNIAKTFTIKEFFVWVFGMITPVYELAFGISQALKLPFDYDFVESTGVFGFTALASMVVTYFVYDKVVFTGKKKEAEEEKGEE